jgi:hypothetical protein
MSRGVKIVRIQNYILFLLKLADVVIDSYTSLNFELPDMIVLPGGLKGAVSTPN